MKHYTLERYYEYYLNTLDNLADTSRKNYVRGLNKVSSLLVEKGKVQHSIYEITDYEKLLEIKHFLNQDIEFLSIDKKGHRMYSVALNHYCRFAGGDKMLDNNSIEIMDIELPKKTMVTIESKQWKRSSIIKRQSIVASNYKCEIDNNHNTFIAERTRKPYMEGHHIIPMRKQNRIDSCLDVYANILCVCPLCHRLLHYGESHTKETYLKKIYLDRSERLANSGIRISFDEFKGLAL